MLIVLAAPALTSLAFMAVLLAVTMMLHGGRHRLRQALGGPVHGIAPLQPPGEVIMLPMRARAPVPVSRLRLAA